MQDQSELRKTIKKCLNALDGTKPIVFGTHRLIENSVPEELYVKDLHGDGTSLINSLADRIDFDEGGGTYLFSGNRGTGKTTELMRLAELLQNQDCEVFYVDMSEYLNLTMSIEITDFLISLLGGFSEKIKERYPTLDPQKIGFFERVWSFLQTEVKLDELGIEAGLNEAVKSSLKFSLRENPTFKQQLQEKTRGHVSKLVQESRRFVEDAIFAIRGETRAPDKKIVLILDSVERLRGVGDSKDINQVFKSVETIFSGHADKLRFQSLYLVCTIPPYLTALAGSLGALYSGGKIYLLPSVHVYENKPGDGNAPQRSEKGLDAMLAIVEKRFPEWDDFFSKEQLLRLAAHSGGDLRDYFRMIGLSIAEALYRNDRPLPDKVLSYAESALRNDMPLAADDKKWLQRILKSHDRELESLDKLPDFARLTEGKYILNYRNGEDWFDVHPLLRGSVREHGGN